MNAAFDLMALAICGDKTKPFKVPRGILDLDGMFHNFEKFLTRTRSKLSEPESRAIKIVLNWLLQDWYVPARVTRLFEGCVKSFPAPSTLSAEKLAERIKEIVADVCDKTDFDGAIVALKEISAVH